MQFKLNVLCSQLLSMVMFINEKKNYELMRLNKGSKATGATFCHDKLEF